MRKFSRFVTILLVCSFILTISAGAVTRESSQIYRYSMKAVPEANGEISIVFSVSGLGSMKKIGAESILIYENVNNKLTLVKSYDKSDSGMSTSNSNIYGNTIYFNGKSGTDYQIRVTVFAESMNGGRDSRSQTFNVTAK